MLKKFREQKLTLCGDKKNSLWFISTQIVVSYIVAFPPPWGKPKHFVAFIFSTLKLAEALRSWWWFQIGGCSPNIHSRANPSFQLAPPSFCPLHARWWGSEGSWWGTIGSEWALKRTDGVGVWAGASLVQQFVGGGRTLLLSKPRYWNTPHYWLKPSKWQLGCQGCWSKVNPNIVWGTPFTPWAHMGSDDIYRRHHNPSFFLFTCSSPTTNLIRLNSHFYGAAATLANGKHIKEALWDCFFWWKV